MTGAKSGNSRSLTTASQRDWRNGRLSYGVVQRAGCLQKSILSSSIILGALCTSELTASAYAGAVTWNGGTGKWSDANWTPAAPGAGDDVTLSVDAKAGNVTLDINDTIDKLTVNPNNTLLLNNGTARTLTVKTSVTNNSKTVQGTTISGGNSMVVGNLKAAAGELINNGKFDVSGGILTVGGNLKNSGSFVTASKGTVTVGGNFNTSGGLMVGRSTVTVMGKLSNAIGDSLGQITVSSGGAVTAGELVIIGNPFTPMDNLTLFGSTLTVTGNAGNKGQIQVGNVGGNAKLNVGGKFTNEGKLSVGATTGGSATNSVSVSSFENTSAVVVNQANPKGGELIVTTGNYTQTDGSTTILGTLDVKTGKYIQKAGDTIVGSATIKGQLTAKGGVEVAGGKLQGSGNVKSPIVKNGGEVIAGFKEPMAGTLSITGDYEQEASGTLDALFQGIAPGDWSVLDISGRAAVDGILDVSTINGFNFDASEIGDVFDIVNFAAGELSGAFSTLEFNDTTTSGSTPTMLNIGNGLALLVGYNDDDVTLTLVASATPVPEPPSLLLFASALAMLLVGSLNAERTNARSRISARRAAD